jgi:hypothetical protein
MFTLSIIPRHLRNQPFAWCPLGFIPKLPAQTFQGQNNANTHRVLDSLLSGLVESQREGGVTCSIRNPSGEAIPLCFKVPLCLSIGDVEGQDLQVGRYASHQTTVLNRECDVTMENADNGDVICNYTVAKDIQALRENNDRAALSAIGYHVSTNAYDKVDFGAGNPYGINGATKSENLHTIQKGWYIYSLAGFLGGLTPAVIVFLEALAQRVSSSCSRQSDRDMPRFRFAQGICKYTNLHANETSGIIMLIAISLHCHLGWDHRNKSKVAANSFARSAFADRAHLESYRHLFETMLCMEAWNKQPVVQKSKV